jgi:hypothetical protein
VGRGKFQTRECGLGRHSGQDLENGRAPSDDPTGWACVPASPHGCFGHRRMDVHTHCRNENSHGVSVQPLCGSYWERMGNSDGAVRCGALQYDAVQSQVPRWQGGVGGNSDGALAGQARARQDRTGSCWE